MAEWEEEVQRSPRPLRHLPYERSDLRRLHHSAWGAYVSTRRTSQRGTATRCVRRVRLGERTLKVRAARAGMSLSDYLLAELEDLTARPSPEEMRERLGGREPLCGGASSVDAVRAVREDRDAR